MTEGIPVLTRTITARDQTITAPDRHDVFATRGSQIRGYCRSFPHGLDYRVRFAGPTDTNAVEAAGLRVPNPVN